ncbi:hypothetical protein BCV70DRAFT_200638 [Testicularia cyperi]|uniref:Uncharacterized protein n=1 Tax=Testicularia cyperi TaxID=1882483 RepID=A0A317XN34_9BASI|nr:hypothetical protein BCV70DRAFT_200638 [Testicularia cyperi]
MLNVKQALISAVGLVLIPAACLGQVMTQMDANDLCGVNHVANVNRPYMCFKTPLNVWKIFQPFDNPDLSAKATADGQLFAIICDDDSSTHHWMTTSRFDIEYYRANDCCNYLIYNHNDKKSYKSGYSCAGAYPTVYSFSP